MAFSISRRERTTITQAEDVLKLNYVPGRKGENPVLPDRVSCHGVLNHTYTTDFSTPLMAKPAIKLSIQALFCHSTLHSFSIYPRDIIDFHKVSGGNHIPTHEKEYQDHIQDHTCSYRPSGDQNSNKSKPSIGF